MSAPWCDRPQLLEAATCAGELRVLASRVEAKDPDGASWMRRSALVLDAGPVPRFVTSDGGPYWIAVFRASSWEAACELVGIPTDATEPHHTDPVPATLFDAAPCTEGDAA